MHRDPGVRPSPPPVAHSVEVGGRYLRPAAPEVATGILGAGAHRHDWYASLRVCLCGFGIRQAAYIGPVCWAVAFTPVPIATPDAEPACVDRDNGGNVCALGVHVYAPGVDVYTGPPLFSAGVRLRYHRYYVLRLPGLLVVSPRWVAIPAGATTFSGLQRLSAVGRHPT